MLGGKAAALVWSRIFGDVRSEFRRRSLAVAVKAARGGRRWEADEGVRIGVKKDGCGGGRFWERRDWVRSFSVGVVIFVSCSCFCSVNLMLDASSLQSVSLLQSLPYWNNSE